MSLLISNVLGSELTERIAPSLDLISLKCLVTIPYAIVLQNYLCVGLLDVAYSLSFNRCRKAFRKAASNWSAIYFLWSSFGGAFDMPARISSTDLLLLESAFCWERSFLEESGF
jgi:hypothetical protein